jgi:hypothetical protein
MDWVFIEAPEFTRRVIKYGLEEELRDLEDELRRNPKAGDVDPAACGLRKVRMGDRGRGQGKRFGARVHYLFAPHRETIYLIFVYRKGVQNLLTSEQRDSLCRWVRAMKPA